MKRPGGVLRAFLPESGPTASGQKRARCVSTTHPSAHHHPSRFAIFHGKVWGKMWGRQQSVCANPNEISIIGRDLRLPPAPHYATHLRWSDSLLLDRRNSSIGLPFGTHTATAPQKWGTNWGIRSRTTLRKVIEFNVPGEFGESSPADRCRQVQTLGIVSCRRSRYHQSQPIALIPAASWERLLEPKWDG